MILSGIRQLEPLEVENQRLHTEVKKKNTLISLAASQVKNFERDNNDLIREIERLKFALQKTNDPQYVPQETTKVKARANPIVPVADRQNQTVTTISFPQDGYDRTFGGTVEQSTGMWWRLLDLTIFV